MADDYDDVGSFAIFPLAPNWARKPTLNLELARFIKKHIGTVAQLDPYTDDVPERLKLGFTIDSKEDEYALIDFFYNRLGKHGKFWIKSPTREFILKEPATAGSPSILVYRNGALQQYQGYERIYIVMNDSDVMGRKVASITDDDINDRYSLNLGTSTDRDLTTTNHVLIARLLLVRYDQDALIGGYDNSLLGEFLLEVVEVPREYGEVV